jgi:hypothetical protein
MCVYYATACALAPNPAAHRRLATTVAIATGHRDKADVRRAVNTTMAEHRAFATEVLAVTAELIKQYQ